MDEQLSFSPAMRAALQELFTSKKFLASFSASLVAIILILAGKFGLGINAEDAKELVEVILKCALTYVGGQAVADLGKHAAEAKAESSAPSV